MLFPSGREDNDVVEVKETGLPMEACQDSIHEAGKGGWSVAETKGTWLNSNSCPLLVRNAVFSLSARRLALANSHFSGPKWRTTWPHGEHLRGRRSGVKGEHP